jgi:hypothetical protein
VFSLRSRRFFRFDLSLLVVFVMLLFCAGGIYQLSRAYPDARRGVLIFAREQKELFIDTGLVEQSYRVQANPALAQVLRSETVIVGTRTPDSTGYLGAGVIVAARDGLLTIVTAKHIVAHDGRRFVVFREGIGRYAARVVPDGEHDLALVFVRALPGVSYRVAHVAAVTFSNGQRFIVMGHPGEGSWVASPGLAQGHSQTTLLFCPTCDRGDSGAGAFDRAGVLRGLIVSKAMMIAPSASGEKEVRLAAFEIERPDAIRSLLAKANR